MSFVILNNSMELNSTRLKNKIIQTKYGFSAEQAVRMTRLRQIREAWELFTATRKFMERSMLNKTSEVGK